MRKANETMTQEGRNRRTVLILEDDAFIALDLESVMEEAGFDVICLASRVDDALDCIAQRAPDLALLDFNLGEETSIPVAEALQEMGVPFFFISGQTRATVLADVDCTNHDTPEVINKPFQPERVTREANRIA